PEQRLSVAHLLSPNLVDYFTKTPPPAPSLPAIPGKIPSEDNPYATLAAIEAATLFSAATSHRCAARGRRTHIGGKRPGSGKPCRENRFGISGLGPSGSTARGAPLWGFERNPSGGLASTSSQSGCGFRLCYFQE